MNGLKKKPGWDLESVNGMKLGKRENHEKFL